ncbi:Ribonuclease H [Yarrowia sp. C11]|nr:Ribonuclease H [Yarrowia sp. E02]KAG5367293.1 Ribonuclease H [Yarrowia sp. C11]
MAKFFAVRKGYQPGIYNSWNECQEQVLGFPSNEHRSFTSRKDAEDYMNGKQFPSNSQIKAAKKNKKTQAATQRPKGSVAHVLDRETGRVVLFVAGACLDNQTSSFASAGTGLFAGVDHADNQSKPLPGFQHSSNRAALVAILEAYKMIRERNDTYKYEIRTVNKMAIDCATVWCRKWLKSGWKNAKGKPVANTDVIQEILKENTAMPGTDKVTLKHVPRGEQQQGTKEAKKLATSGVRSCRNVLCSCGKVLVHAQ